MSSSTRIFYFLLLFFATSSQLKAQIWTDISKKSAASTNKQLAISVNSYRSLTLDSAAFKEAIENGQEGNTVVDLPIPDGAMMSFQVFYSPIMETGLANKYPSIQTFQIRSVDQPTITGRMQYTSKGIHAIILGHQKGTILIEPLFEKSTSHYASYYAKDDQSIATANKIGANLSCGNVLNESSIDREKSPNQSIENKPISKSRSKNAAVDLQVYRIALACTGEFVSYHRLREKGEVLFEFVTLLSIANAIFERDFAIQFQLIEETEELIFLEATTDPFTGDGSVFSLVEQASFAIETRVEVNKFDIAHILTSNCFSGGGPVGVVTGLACTVAKSQGVSCQFQSNTVFAANIFAHELGHQFSGSHTWSNCPGSEGQRAAAPYEPGSGSTIMSYAGACGPFNNIQSNSDPYFHAATIEEVEIFESNNNCGTAMPTSNLAPEAIIPIAGDFFIPINTPFQLEGVGMDENGEELTYSWEQFDIGPAGDLRTPRQNAPTFRSYPPSNSASRIFPALETIITNISDDKELLPTYARDFTFRFTVRDNHPEAGGVDWETIKFKATDTAGPFVVTFPNKGIDAVSVGEEVEVLWDVANTNQAPVNCQKVNILLSIDGGYTYPSELILATNVANDGAQVVSIPDLITTKARIKVEAADNIFFDISNNNFDIRNPTEAGFSFATSIQSQQICLPEQVTIDLNTVSLLAFSEGIDFTIAGLPAGATTNFEKDTTIPGEQNKLTIDFSQVVEEGDYEIQIQGIAAGAATISRNIEFQLVRNDFSDLQLLSPVQNSVGISLPNYEWTESQDALTYDIEIATSPTFGNSMIDKASNIRSLTYPSSVTLIPNTVYYWRVIPSNECGLGRPSPIYAFQTESFSCTIFNSNQVPILISSQGTPTISSTVDVIQDFTISDLNIPILRGRHDWVSHIEARLISPQETTVVLMSRKCPGSVPFNIGFDDEAPSDIPCPPNDGIPHLPHASLTAFDGEQAAGTWTLEIEVLDGFGEGGSLDEWGLEFCSNISLSPPTLVVNEALPVQPSKGRTITTAFLEAQDANNTKEELIFTLIALPLYGQLSRNGIALQIGDTFTQKDIEEKGIQYNNENTSQTIDRFSFTVADGEGGWIGITPFTILLDPEETITATTEVVLAQQINVFPNPVDEVLFVASVGTQQIKSIRIFSLKGQLLSPSIPTAASLVKLSVGDLSAGIYFLQVELERGVVWKKVVVE